MVKKIISIVVTILVVGWLALVFVDYFKVTNDKEAQFCIKRETIKTGDNSKTERCTGLGYVADRYYEEDQLAGYEFRPFFIKSKKSEK